MTRPVTYWIAYEAQQQRAHDASPVSSLEGRTAVAQGRHYKGWLRFHPDAQPVRIVDAWGRERWLTPLQHRVWVAALALQDDHSERVSMSKMAASLGVAASSVYRALIRLASFGLVSYDTKRGRNGGVTFVLLTAKQLKTRATAAWERIKAEREKVATRWHSRLQRSGYDFAALNVASIVSSAQRLAYYSVGSVPWTADDMVEAGL